MNNLFYILYGIALVIIGVIGTISGYVLRKNIAEGKLLSAEERAKRILEEAEKQVDAKKKEAIIEAKDKLYKVKAEFEQESKVRSQELQLLEKRLRQKEENIERKVDVLDRKERELVGRERELLFKEKTVKEKDESLGQMIAEERNKLERISGLTQENARKMLLSSLEIQAKQDAAATIKKIEDEAKEEAAKTAQRIISVAIQRCAMDHTAENSVSVINLPNEEMKGRIIGREGRNIRALESATGVDIIIDDTPEAVVISGFDVVRREIARLSLERLIADGRIHPARIEEVVEKVKQEIENTIRETGERAALQTGVAGLHPEIIKLLGKLKYRTSYGQNVLSHSLEVAFLASNIASELGIDPAMVKRAGLLHDIGKAVDHEVEGTHPQLGSDIAKKFHEPAAIVNAIAEHHSDDIQRSLEAVIIQAADAISGSRPGARGDTKENYIKRLKKLEEIAESFGGVKKSYAIQAGREVRILVEHQQMNDVEASQLARDIAQKVEKDLQYPGQIKVTVIRESRYVEYAK